VRGEVRGAGVAEYLEAVVGDQAPGIGARAAVAHLAVGAGRDVVVQERRLVLGRTAAGNVDAGLAAVVPGAEGGKVTLADEVADLRGSRRRGERGGGEDGD